MIGGIESRTFEDNPNRLENFVKGFLGTLRAARQGLIGKFLLYIELNTAILATVSINRHENLGLTIYL